MNNIILPISESSADPVKKDKDIVDEIIEIIDCRYYRSLFSEKDIKYLKIKSRRITLEIHV